MCTRSGSGHHSGRFYGSENLVRTNQVTAQQQSATKGTRPCAACIGPAALCKSLEYHAWDLGACEMDSGLQHPDWAGALHTTLPEDVPLMTSRKAPVGGVPDAGVKVTATARFCWWVVLGSSPMGHATARRTAPGKENSIVTAVTLIQRQSPPPPTPTTTHMTRHR
jgi:hypothetical protein